MLWCRREQLFRPSEDAFCQTWQNGENQARKFDFQLSAKWDKMRIQRDEKSPMMPMMAMLPMMAMMPMMR